MNGGQRILRVFPRRTRATPNDDLVRIGAPGLLDPPECDEVHVSVTFSWDKNAGEHLAYLWGNVHPCVKLGGPAFGKRSGDFVPGRYLGLGHVITSRGCPNHCWFCNVPVVEGGIRTLPIVDGWIVHDSNLLACGRRHCQRVFSMLARQPEKPRFVGGLEAKRVRPWHA